MGCVFEELIRIGAEQANEEAGEHFTPREVIKRMVNLLLSPAQDLARSHVVKTICGSGGMLAGAEQYRRVRNADAQPKLFGQDWNDEAWAICKSAMLIRGEDADRIILGDTFTKDGFDRTPDGRKWTCDTMLAIPPCGVEWQQQQRYIAQEHDTRGCAGYFGAGTPRASSTTSPSGSPTRWPNASTAAFRSSRASPAASIAATASALTSSFTTAHSTWTH